MNEIESMKMELIPFYSDDRNMLVGWGCPSCKQHAAFKTQLDHLHSCKWYENRLKEALREHHNRLDNVAVDDIDFKDVQEGYADSELCKKTLELLK